MSTPAFHEFFKCSQHLHLNKRVRNQLNCFSNNQMSRFSQYSSEKGLIQFEYKSALENKTLDFYPSQTQKPWN